MRKYVITNINNKIVYIRGYKLMEVIAQCEDLTVYATDVEDVILSTTDNFKVGEYIQGREIFSKVSYCRAMEEM